MPVLGGGHAGVVSGAMNMADNLGGTLSPLVAGASLDRYHSWEAPLVSVAELYLLAVLCWLGADATDRMEQDCDPLDQS